MRALTNKDIATGRVSTTDNKDYSTTGPSSTWQIKNEVPDSPVPTCYVRAFASSCTPEQQKAVLNGTALVKDWVVIDTNIRGPGNDTAGNGTSSADRPNIAARSGKKSGSKTGSSANSTTTTGEGVELQVQLSFIALVLAIAVAVVA
jgi:hypothetical protein